MAQGRTLRENLAVRMGGTPGAWAANASTYGNWVHLAGVGRRALIIALNGELDADMLVEVFEATSGSGTGAQELTGITTGQTFVNGTDEGKVGVIEVLDSDLTSGFEYIAVRPTPGAADSFAAVIVIGDLYEAPADNAAADGVTFAVGG